MITRKVILKCKASMKGRIKPNMLDLFRKHYDTNRINFFVFAHKDELKICNMEKQTPSIIDVNQEQGKEFLVEFYITATIGVTDFSGENVWQFIRDNIGVMGVCTDDLFSVVDTNIIDYVCL